MEPQITSSQCTECGKPLKQGAIYCDACGRLCSTATIARPGHPGESSDPPRRLATPQRTVFQFTRLNHGLVALLVVSAVFAVAYRFNSADGLLPTYATFVGLPLLIGALTAYLVRPQTGIGMTLKITTVILCVVCPLLGEGSVCILMAAPLFYGIAVIGYVFIAALVRLAGGIRGGRVSCMAIALLPFVAGMLTNGPEGIRRPDTLIVSSETNIAAPPEVVWNTLLHGKLVSTRFPWFLTLGFPLPTGMDRLPGGLVHLRFDPGSEPWPGTNTIVSRQVTDSSARTVRFIVLKDGTKLSRWLSFREETFTVQATPAGTRLRETTTFRQRLQPGAYWNRLEGFAVEQMHAYALGDIQRLAETRRAETRRAETRRAETRRAETRRAETRRAENQRPVS